MIKIPIYILIPTFIERIVVWFLLRYRKKHFDVAFRKIKLTKGQYTIVSPEDYEKLACDDWQLAENRSKNLYAARVEGTKVIYMHRVIMNAPKGVIVDHKNRETLDNTRGNLRFATKGQNNRNRPKCAKGASSKYKGVSRRKLDKKWRAVITHEGRHIHLGSFEKEEDAARAYDAAAKIYFGEFAVLNFDDDGGKMGVAKGGTPSMWNTEDGDAVFRPVVTPSK